MHGHDSTHELVSIPIDITIDDPSETKNLVERKYGGNKRQHSFDSEEDKSRKIDVLSVILQDRDAKHLAIFIVMMGLVTLYQLVIGFSVENLGLVSAAFHSFFHLIALIISLSAMVLSKRKATAKYSYGLNRLEILSGFTNAIFVLFVGLWILFESIEKLFEIQEDHESDHFVTVVNAALIGIIINVIGVIYFHEYKQTRSESRYQNLSGISYNIVLDASTQLGVIGATFLNSYGFTMADPITAILIAGWIGYNVVPICISTGSVLLQSTPVKISNQLRNAKKELQAIEGVISCSDDHFWTQSPDVYVGSIKIKIKPDINQQVILVKARSLLSPFITHLTVQINQESE
jgi:zinc transporter 5/7